MAYKRDVQLTMFSIFCAHSAGEEESEGIQYLNEKNTPTFDTLETEGTDDSSSCIAVDKNLAAESLLDNTGTFFDAQDSFELEASNEMNEGLLVTREDGELRDEVPLIQNEESSPGLAADLTVPVAVEGPDIPAHDEHKRKVEPMDIMMNVVSKADGVGCCGGVESTALVVYQPTANLLLHAPRSSDVSNDEDPAHECVDEPSISGETPEEEVLDSAALDKVVCLSPIVSKGDFDADGEKEPAKVSPRTTEIMESVENTPERADVKNEQGREAVTSTPIDDNASPGARDKSVEEEEEGTILDSPKESCPPSLATASVSDSSRAQPVDSHSSSTEVDKIASHLLMPMLDHSDTDVPPDEARISPLTSSGEVTSLGSIESNETGSDSLDEYEKSVRFAEPLVTSSWDVPRVHSDDLEALFYTAMDISKFRRQQRSGGPARPYDKAHCEKLVEDLDRVGAESFVAGDYQKALGAFNHSLQVKTQIMTDYDNCSTATTIHCIADIYSKKGKWIQAMDAYNAALEVLHRAEETDEVRLSKVALAQKIHIIRRLLGVKR